MHDAVFIGSGHNNLVAAIILAKAGWKVIVLEQADDVGGAIRTAELTLPGFRHDFMSNTHVLFRASPFYQDWQSRLEDHGLAYVAPAVPVASLFPDGDAVYMREDIEGTKESLARQSAEDAEGWQKLYDLYEMSKDLFLTLFTSPLPSLSTMTAIAGPRLRLGASGNMEFFQMLTLPVRRFVENYFRTEKPKAWLAPWALHLTHSPETAGGGVFTWLVLGMTQDPAVKEAIPQGGGGGLTQALASLLAELGGEVRVGSRVAKIIVRGNMARGVKLADGTEIRADRAVVAGTSPTRLFLDLVGEDKLPAEFVGRLLRYRYGLPVVKLDFALSKPPEWKAGGDSAKALLLHLSPGLDAMSEAYNQALRGYLPETPLLIVTQPTVIDPSRAPEGKHILWVVARVPYEVKGDAGRRIAPRPWGLMKERVADRITGVLEDYAPGFKETILARNIFSPEDLEELNPNLVHGDVGSGSVEFDQSYVFRPMPGWSRYLTPIRRLFLCGAATHPGPGITGMSGGIVGRMLAK